jgi:hypothetical protein
MDIPKDVQIIFDKSYSDSALYNFTKCIRECDSRLWVNAGDGSFNFYYSDRYMDRYMVSGHFARTVKTRRVVWDLPDGITIEPELKAKMEACVLKSNQHPYDMREAVGEWWYCVGKTKSFHHSKCGLLLLVSIVESTEEVPWSPFEVEK